jgi:hypothetical protein
LWKLTLDSGLEPLASRVTRVLSFYPATASPLFYEKHPDYSAFLRVKVRSNAHIFLPPFVDENGTELNDVNRSDFFEVWANGRRKRLVAFSSINIIETQEPDGKEPAIRSL